MAKPGLGARLKNLFSSSSQGEDFYEDFEDMLIEGDIGAAAAMEISDQLREKFGRKRPSGRDEAAEVLGDILSGMVKTTDPAIEKGRLNIILVLGVNGVGKTTTIAKMTEFYRENFGTEALLSAGDTFRAAAIDQLKLHAERLGVKIVHQQPGSDPGAVIYDSIESALSRGNELIIADTAGRMHNKANLVMELQKIDRIIANKAPDAVYRKVLVIDSTTGQNGFRQAELFHEAVGIDQIILAKYDSSAKGGIVIPISSRLGLPFVFIGTGEKYGDLKRFDRDDFIRKMLSE